MKNYYILKNWNQTHIDPIENFGEAMWEYRYQKKNYPQEKITLSVCREEISEVCAKCEGAGFDSCDMSGEYACLDCTLI